MMAKLNKQEVNAIANKIVRKLAKEYEVSKLRYISEYKPSPNYIKAEALVNKYLTLSTEAKRIEEERTNTYDELSELYGSLGLNRYFAVSRKILKDIIDKECNLKEIPSVESLKEDIVIAGIDDTFDVEKFIKDKLAEYIS